MAYYVGGAGQDVAARFVDSLERCLTYVARNPHCGSLRFAYDLDLPELRCRGIARYPYLVFYVEREQTIDVWRVLHSRRDLPATLRALDR